MTHQVVVSSNYSDETFAEYIIAQTPSESFGEILAESLNSMGDGYGTAYYKLVPMDYVLWRGMEELI